jgi:hypothetical protein
MSTSRPSCDFRRWIVLAAWVAAASPAASQSVLQFDKWMQRIDRRSQGVQRNLALRDPVAAAADAREVGELYRLLEVYFTQRGDAVDAVRLSRDGAALADAVITSVQANDFDAASRSALSIARACRDCHIEYKPLP